MIGEEEEDLVRNIGEAAFRARLLTQVMVSKAVKSLYAIEWCMLCVEEREFATGAPCRE